MSLKRKLAISGSILLLLSLLLICLMTAAYFYLPFYLESRVIPQLAADAGLSDFAVKIRNIGFFNADLGTLRIGPPEIPAFVIRSVQVDYSPRSLYQQKIKKITLSGVEIHGEFANGLFKLRGVDMQKIMAGAQQRQKAAPDSNDTSSPVILARLEIRDSQAIIGYNANIYRIPFEIDMVPQDPAYNVLDVTAHLYLRGEKITAAANVNRPQRQAALSIDCVNLNLDRFTDIAARVDDLLLSGETTLQAKAQVHWEPWQISSVNASLTLHRGKIKGGGFQLQTAMTANDEEIPFRLDLSAKNTNEWQISGSRISMTAPTHLTVTGIDGMIKRNAVTLESSGNFNMVLGSSIQTSPDLLPIKIQTPIPLQGRFSAIYHQSGKWQGEVVGKKSEEVAAQTVHLKIEPYTITSSAPEFNFSAQAESGNVDAAYLLAVPTVRITSGTETINIPKLLLKGTAHQDNTAKDSAEVGFDLRVPNTAIKLKEGTIKISDISISGKLNRDDGRQMTLGGELQFAGAGGQFSGFGAQVAGARGKIPFEWPVTGKTAKGSISVTSLKYKGMQLGSVSSQIRQTATGFAFEGRHQSALLPRMKLNFTGESKLFIDAPAGASVHVNLTRPANAPEIDLGKFSPDAKGIRIKGKFELDGDLALGSKGFGGMIRADVNNSDLFLGKNSLAFEGVSLSLSLPELPKIRSAPGQQIRFARISLGDFAAQKGLIDFQIESTRSILIEKMRFLWCDGNVETQSMRLSPGVEDYRLTFYCDRLNLAKVLGQFGAAAAEGRGAVNGRIPLQYADGKISFDDGFLFSTPGDGGKIRLTGTDILTAGIPPNTPQFVQMELAREALRDYDYTWAKLNITSQEEELLLQMQMDGKPAQTLPFVYKKDIGGFMKVEANAKGSKFQGIRLDVNFRLPLNKLLQYKDIINMIQ